MSIGNKKVHRHYHLWTYEKGRRWIDNHGFLQGSDGFDFTQHALGEGLDGDTAAGGLGNEILGIDLVEGGKIIHIRQKTGGFEHLGEIRAGGFQNSAHFAAALVSLGFDALGNCAGGGVYGDLTGGVDKTVDNKALAVGTDGAGGMGSFNYLPKKYLPFLWMPLA